MRVAIGCDHAGFRLKEIVAAWLTDHGHDVVDFGTQSEEPVDYPSFCAAAARAVVDGEADFGIVLGGSGQGEQMAANKVHGIRAALCYDETSARLARQHNNANVLALGGRLLGDTLALRIVEVFESTHFEGGRHQPRLDQIAEIETAECARRRGAAPA